MAEKISHKKPITATTPPEKIGDSQPFLQKSDFNKAIFGQGYNSLIERALPCACRDSGTGNALSNCCNCGGSSWIFVNKTATVLLAQSMNRKTKFQNWTEEDRGNVSITARASDRLAYMDRITNLELTSIHSEVVNPLPVTGGELLAFLIYFPTEIEMAYLFQSVDKAYLPLVENTDFTITENRLVLNNKLKNKFVKEFSVVIRYKHNPQFHVIDITREISATEPEDCKFDNPQQELDKLPMHAVARRAHYILDAPNLAGRSLFDNTIVPAP